MVNPCIFIYKHPTRTQKILLCYSPNQYFLEFFFRKHCGIKKNSLTLPPQNRKGVIAQLVEQRTENPCVPGSIPGDTTLKSKANP